MTAEVKHRCRLYVQVPAQASALLATQFSQALAGSDAACVLLCWEESPLDEAHVASLVDLVEDRGVAVLIKQDAALAERLGADGVHIEANATTYAACRNLLGESASIGVGCGLNRHHAMLLAELGADYVAFGDPDTIDTIDRCAELISWWSEIFVVPCVAWDVDNAEQAAKLATLGDRLCRTLAEYLATRRCGQAYCRNR
jgi:thiamine-phosphate pyrophosphorylase